MECETLRHGQYYAEPLSPQRRGVKRKLGCGAVGHLQLDNTTPLSCADPPQPVYFNVVPSHPPPINHHPHHLPDLPFMSNMDEITYWIFTKRAPCLMNYDNLVTKQNQESSFSKPTLVTADEGPSPKKKKRKLSLLDDESDSQDKQQNVYFVPSQQNQRIVMSSCNSDTLDSDIDFNIKNSSIQDRRKRLRLQKNSLTTLHKKNKVVTSTPKVSTALRRSLRKAQNGVNSNNPLKVSYEALNTTVMNGNHIKSSLKKQPEKCKKSPDKRANGDHNDCKKIVLETGKIKKGQFEDLSDVSGFTANYIRSTKLHSAKTPRNLRNKGSRNLMKESRHLKKDDNTMLVCVNKSMNTSTNLPKVTVLNCSTDSSQNVINLVTVHNNNNCARINKSTSLLKFMETKTQKIMGSGTNKLEISKQNKTNLNVSFLSRSSSTSRYPIRHKNTSRDVTAVNSTTQISHDTKRRLNKSTGEFNNSDRKENPEDKSKYRTRSGRSTALKLRQPENSVFVISNTTEPITSVTMNVAVPLVEDRPRDNLKMKKHTSRVKYVGCAKQSIDKSGQSLKSLRNQSGFADCFSDSDDDSEPLKQRKFFC